MIVTAKPKLLIFMSPGTKVAPDIFKPTNYWSHDNPLQRTRHGIEQFIA